MILFIVAFIPEFVERLKPQASDIFQGLWRAYYNKGLLILYCLKYLLAKVSSGLTKSCFIYNIDKRISVEICQVVTESIEQCRVAPGVYPSTLGHISTAYGLSISVA